MEPSIFEFIETEIQFQSLVGFKINWNTSLDLEDLATVWKFQSLVGFKINWNSYYANFYAGQYRFQSLVGFKINWNYFLALF